MKYFLSGLIVGVILFALGFIFPGHVVAVIAVIAGGICLIGAGLLSGAFINGNQVRANFWMNSEEDRKKDNSLSGRLFLLGFPVLAAGILLFIL